MVRALVRLILVLIVLPALAAQDYQGAWFTISYPDGFNAIAGLPSTTADGPDSARFHDPAGRVEFYVYSPQAGGVAADIVADPATENQIAIEDKQGRRRFGALDHLCGEGRFLPALGRRNPQRRRAANQGFRHQVPHAR